MKRKSSIIFAEIIKQVLQLPQLLPLVYQKKGVKTMLSEKSNLEHKQAIYERRNREIENEIDRLIEEKRANNNAIANIDIELQQDYEHGGVLQWRN